MYVINVQHCHQNLMNIIMWFIKGSVRVPLWLGFNQYQVILVFDGNTGHHSNMEVGIWNYGNMEVWNMAV